MLCWLAFGEHEALERDFTTARILIPAEGKPTSTPRIYPSQSRETTLRRPPREAQNALLAGIWGTPSHISRGKRGVAYANTLRRPPLGGPNALLASIW